MANRTGRTVTRQGPYIDGNVVRRTEVLPQYETQPRRKEAPPKTREEIIREKNKRRAARRNQQRALEMNRGYVAFLVVATFVCFCVCLLFVHVQADNTARIKTITSLENQISNLREDNLAIEKRLETTINLEEVKQAATSMGFAYPEEEQIEYYTIEDGDYMNQFGAIPSK